MGTFSNSGDPDEMPHNAAFHRGYKRSKTKDAFFGVGGILTRHPKICIMD